MCLVFGFLYLNISFMSIGGCFYYFYIFSVKNNV